MAVADGHPIFAPDLVFDLALPDPAESTPVAEPPHASSLVDASFLFVSALASCMSTPN